jgi:hypothetical protein
MPANRNGATKRSATPHDLRRHERDPPIVRLALAVGASAQEFTSNRPGLHVAVQEIAKKIRTKTYPE